MIFRPSSTARRHADATTGGEASVRLPVLDDRRTIRASRSGPRRAVVLALVQLIMIVHVVQWVITGSTLTPLEPSESMELVKSGVVNAGAILFALALIATLILGRWFCGWGCHLVMLQDLCRWMLLRVGIRPKPFRSRLLLYVPFLLALYMFVWPVVYRLGLVPLSAVLHRHLEVIPALPAAPPWSGFSMHLTTSDFWQTFPGVLVAIPFLLICGFATVYFLGNKGFCTYGCPYGGFFAPLEQYAPARIRVTDACDRSGHCTAVCSSNVRVHEEVREYGMVVDPGCMKCLDCVSVCPNDALYYGLGRPAVARGQARQKPPKRVHDLTLVEEAVLALVFVLAFLSFRGVYGLVPMLMAVGTALVTTYLSWKLWSLVRDPSVNFHRFRLKYKGTVTRAGVVFAALAALAIGLTAHSGVVNGLEHLAARTDGRVTIPRSAIFTPSPLGLPPAMAADARGAIRWYRLAGPIGSGGIGLIGHPEQGVRLAWLHACLHEFDVAERLLREHMERFGPADHLCRDLGLLIRMQGRDEAALEHYEEVIRTSPHFVQTLDDLVLWHEAEGRTAAATTVCREALARLETDTPEALQVMRRLSLLEVNWGDLDTGIDLIRRTIEIDDANPNAYRVLARAYVKRGDPEAAVEALRKAIVLAPHAPEPHEDLADILEPMGRTAEAEVARAEARRLRKVQRQ